jgi:hypothetical protein
MASTEPWGEYKGKLKKTIDVHPAAHSANQGASTLKIK